MENTVSIRLKPDTDYLDQIAKIDKALESAGYPKHPVTVTVKREEGSISDKQRAYYFGVVVEIGRQFRGYSREEMHEWYKKMYLPDYEWLWSKMSEVYEENKTVDDMRIVMTKFLSLHEDLSITNETVGGFENYLKRIREGESRVYQVFIPLPNEDQQWQNWELMK